MKKLTFIVTLLIISINIFANPNKDLVVSASKGNLNKVRASLKSGANVNFKMANGVTAILVASAKGYYPIVSFLISKKADVNISDKRGITPLMAASANGFLRIVNTLIKNRADVNVKDKRNKNALHYAVGSRKPARAKIAKILIKSGCNLNVQDRIGFSPLMVAAFKGRERIAYLLLKNRANPDLKMKKYGVTALIIASRYGRVKIVKMLLQHKAKINVKDSKNLTALDYAKKNNRKNVVKVLRKAGAK